MPRQACAAPDRLGARGFSAYRASSEDDLIAEGWFGLGDPHPLLGARLGDYLLIGREAHVLTEHLSSESEWSMIGVHGGLSTAKMQVPLLVVEC